MIYYLYVMLIFVYIQMILIPGHITFKLIDFFPNVNTIICNSLEVLGFLISGKDKSFIEYKFNLFGP